MKAQFLFLLFLGVFACVGAPAQALFDYNLLWTGSWYKSIRSPDIELPSTDEIFSGGTLYNRGDLSLGLPRQELSLRYLATDKRLLPLEEDDGRAGFNPALGLYHRGSGSRILYGVQTEFGLPERVNNVWLHGIPFMESRSPSSRDFKLEPAARDRAESYLYLALPYDWLPGFDAFFSAALDDEMNMAFGSGIGFGRNSRLIRFEGFYTRKELAPRRASTWFSEAPPLPQRDFDIYALSMLFNTPNLAFATDWAFSETFAWGQGTYGNFALRLGQRPWRFSVAGDGATNRFADRSGSTAGAGLRLGARAERFWPRSGLLRFQTSLRAPSLHENLNRGNLSVYYRPSAPSAAERRLDNFPMRFSRASISLNRNARNLDKTADSLNTLLGYQFGPLSGSLSFALNSLSSLAPDNTSLFQYPLFESFDSFRVSGELTWRPGIFDIRTRLGYTIREEKDPIIDFSLNCSARPGRWGRVGLRIACTDFPERWNYTLSWRYVHH